MAEILTEKTKGQVNAAIINDITSQINTRAEQMAQQWRRIKIEGGNYELNRAKFETEADKMYQQLDLEKWRLNNEEKTMAEILTEKTKGQVNAAIINDVTSQINTRAEQMAQQWRRIKIEGGNLS